MNFSLTSIWILFKLMTTKIFKNLQKWLDRDNMIPVTYTQENLWHAIGDFNCPILQL